MDARQFDTVVKALGNGTTRRRVLHGLLSGAGVALLTHVAGESAEAAGVCQELGFDKTYRPCGDLGCFSRKVDEEKCCRCCDGSYRFADISLNCHSDVCPSC
jgi:hypothetical protein